MSLSEEELQVLARLDSDLGDQPLELCDQPIRLQMDYRPESVSDLLEALEHNKFLGRISTEEALLGGSIILSFLVKQEINGVEEYISDSAAITELPILELGPGEIEVVLAVKSSWEKYEQA